MTRLPGITGSLLPAQYLADGATGDQARWMRESEAIRHRAWRWWTTVSERCGPASGVHAICDLVAMPLVGMLGFRARHVTFEPSRCRAWLETPAGGVVALLVLPWSARPSALWRDVWLEAAAVGATWGFVLAPPHLSLVCARGQTTRRSLEFALPAVLDPPALPVFWSLARAGAFEPTTADGRTWLDAVVDGAASYAAAVQKDLQRGVAGALGALAGVVGHRVPRPTRARAPDDIAPGDRRSGLDEALTLVYRILFLLFAESRDVVPHADPVYGRAYSVSALCRDAVQESKTGLWDALAATTRLSRHGCRTSALQTIAFNGQLFARSAAPSLEARRPPKRSTPASRQRDAALGRAMIALASRPGRAGRETISYRDLGVEQLGAVYERLLDLDPEASLGRTPPQRPAAPAGRRHSRARRETGTFYTPQPLAELVVRRTLAPLVAGASADTIVRLRVLDPAMGSGACLVAACHFLAAAYGRALVDEGRAAAADLDDAAQADIRRLIAERCLAGVDRNPTAVELARLSLWLTTLAHDRPLTFLDHRLRVGDSLAGGWPDDLNRLGLGRSRAGRPHPLFDTLEIEHAIERVRRPVAELIARRDASVADVHAKEALWRRLTADSSPLHRWREALTLWCARWFWPSDASPTPGEPETRALLDGLLRHDPTIGRDRLRERVGTANAIGLARGFFHWPLEFPDVFYDDCGHPATAAGFDAVLGNPPWEMLRADDHLTAGRAGARRTGHDRHLMRFIRDSGQYACCDRGHLNLYQAFTERALSITRPGGRLGLVLPWGLASDDGAAGLRRRLLEHTSIDTLVGIDNAAGLFPIHRGVRFMVLVTSPGRATRELHARFGVTTAGELDALPGRDDPSNPAYPVRLPARTIEAVSGPSWRWPDLPEARRPRTARAAHGGVPEARRHRWLGSALRPRTERHRGPRALRGGGTARRRGQARLAVHRLAGGASPHRPPDCAAPAARRPVRSGPARLSRRVGRRQPPDAHRRGAAAGRRDDPHAAVPAITTASRAAVLPVRPLQLLRPQRPRQAPDGRSRHDESRRGIAGAALAWRSAGSDDRGAGSAAGQVARRVRASFGTAAGSRGEALRARFEPVPPRPRCVPAGPPDGPRARGATPRRHRVCCRRLARAG